MNLCLQQLEVDIIILYTVQQKCDTCVIIEEGIHYFFCQNKHIFDNVTVVLNRRYGKEVMTLFFDLDDNFLETPILSPSTYFHLAAQHRWRHYQE